MRETPLAPCSPRALYHQQCERLGCRKNPVLLQVLPNALNTFHLVTALDLTAARLGPSGCQALLEVIRLTLQLRSLCLADNELDDSCVRQLLGTLSGRKALAYLDLSDNPCGGEGLGEALVQFAGETPGLQELRLQGTEVPAEHLDGVLDRLAANRKAAAAPAAAVSAPGPGSGPPPIVLPPAGEPGEAELPAAEEEPPEDESPSTAADSRTFLAPWKRPPSHWLAPSGRVSSAPARTGLPPCGPADPLATYPHAQPPRRPPSALQRPSARLSMGLPEPAGVLRPCSAPRPGGSRISSASRYGSTLGVVEPPPPTSFDGSPRWHTSAPTLDGGLDSEEQIDKLLTDGQLVEQVASCLFKLADKTGSGTLSTIELAVVLHHTVVELSLLPPPPGEVRVVLEPLDLGQAGTLTELEFVHAVRSYLLRRKRAANGGRPATSSLPSLVDRHPPRHPVPPPPSGGLPAAPPDPRGAGLPAFSRRPSDAVSVGGSLALPHLGSDGPRQGKRDSESVAQSPEPDEWAQDELEQLLEEERRSFLEEDRQREEAERQRARAVLAQRQQLRSGGVTDFQCWMQEELQRLTVNRPAPPPPPPPAAPAKKGRRRPGRAKEGPRGPPPTTPPPRGPPPHPPTVTVRTPQEEKREELERFLKDVLAVDVGDGPPGGVDSPSGAVAVTPLELLVEVEPEAEAAVGRRDPFEDTEDAFSP